MKTFLQRTRTGAIIVLLIWAMSGFAGENRSSVNFMLMSPSLAGPITTAGNNTVCSGYSFTIPVTVTDFNNVGVISLKLIFDTAMVVYQSATIHPALSGLLPVYGASGNQFSLSGYGDPGVTLADNSTLFTLTFLAKAGVSGTTFFTWSTEPGDC